MEIKFDRYITHLAHYYHLSKHIDDIRIGDIYTYQNMSSNIPFLKRLIILGTVLSVNATNVTICMKGVLLLKSKELFQAQIGDSIYFSPIDNKLHFIPLCLIRKVGSILSLPDEDGYIKVNIDFGE